MINDVIIDASMPASIRNSGKMWGQDGKFHDTKAVIPDQSYTGVYQETINFCKTHREFDPVTVGSVENVGLMAKKAEEYGSHDKTFHISDNGIIRVVDHTGAILLKHNVDKGDIENNKSPLHNFGERDTRSSHFYLALYWAKALAKQSDCKAFLNP